MNSNPRFLITSKQLIFVLVGCILGIGYLSLPREISTASGQDAWISVIIGSLFPFLSLFLLSKLGSIFPALTVVEILQMLLGGVTGSLLSILLIAYFLNAAAVVLRGMTEIVSTFMLPQTPTFIVAGLFSITIWYSAKRGLKVLGRLNELLFYVFLLALITMVVPLVNADVTNLLPIFEAAPVDLIKDAVAASFAFSGIEILLVIYPMVTRREEILKAGLTALGCVLTIYVFITVICLLVFGSEALQYEMWPLLTLAKTQEIPVLQRGDLFFLLMLLGFGIKPVVNFVFASSYCLVQILKRDENRYYSPLAFVITIIVLCLSLIPANTLTFFNYQRIVGIISPIIGVGFPVFLLALSWLRKGGAAGA